MKSPYDSIPQDQWPEVTKELVAAHPLKVSELTEIVLSSWESIFQSKFGSTGFKIGRDIFPKPQIMGFLLHELIPLELVTRYPGQWQGERKARDKDLVFLPDSQFSIEVKTSSNPSHIFGNRSYAQEASEEKKVKSGYYLAINFEKFTANRSNPRILQVRFGWLDAADWIGQKAATGQQSRLPPHVEQGKFMILQKS